VATKAHEGQNADVIASLSMIRRQVQKSRGPTTTLGDTRFLWARMVMVTQIGSGMVAGTGERKMARPARGKLQRSASLSPVTRTLASR
jgi:hypothetical protein